jgi:hypothetical protein
MCWIGWAPNSIPIYIQQDATLHSLFISTALHVSGGTSTHHQERIELYLQHLVFVTPLLLSAAVVEELEPVWVCCGWRTPPTAHYVHTMFMVGPAGPTTNIARLSPRYEGKTRGCHCSHWAPDDGRGNARNTLSCKWTSGYELEICCIWLVIYLNLTDLFVSREWSRAVKRKKAEKKGRK